MKTTRRNTGRILEADLVISSGCFILWRIGLIYMVRVAKKCVSAISKTFLGRMTSKKEEERNHICCILFVYNLMLISSALVASFYDRPD